MTLRLYLFTRGPSAGVNVVDGSFDNIVVGGQAWWNPTYSFSAGPLGSGGAFGSGGVSGQLYGPSSPDKVAPTRGEGRLRLSTAHRQPCWQSECYRHMERIKMTREVTQAELDILTAAHAEGFMNCQGYRAGAVS